MPAILDRHLDFAALHPEKRICAEAMFWLTTRYRVRRKGAEATDGAHGSSASRTIDCSGFVVKVFDKVFPGSGLNPHTVDSAALRTSSCSETSVSPQEGDLICRVVMSESCWMQSARNSSVRKHQLALPSPATGRDTGRPSLSEIQAVGDTTLMCDRARRLPASQLRKRLPPSKRSTACAAALLEGVAFRLWHLALGQRSTARSERISRTALQSELRSSSIVARLAERKARRVSRVGSDFLRPVRSVGSHKHVSEWPRSRQPVVGCALTVPSPTRTVEKSPRAFPVGRERSSDPALHHRYIAGPTWLAP